MITPQQLKTVFPTCRNPGPWCRIFEQVVDEFGLRAPNRLAMWLAQCGYESEGFNVLRELFSYRTAASIVKVWPHKFANEDAAQKFVLQPSSLANFVYAGENGNGDFGTGDGFKYRGGGLIQLTGRANYKGVGTALSLDLEMRPQQIEIPQIAARTAGFFWKQNDLNAAADDGDFDYTTRRVNGAAMEGAADRKALWEKLMKVMNAPSALTVAVATRRSVPPVMDGLMAGQMKS